MFINPVYLIVTAGILGGVARAVFGFLGENNVNESFSFKKFFQTIVRAIIGGAILAYSLQLSPREVFFAAIASDVGIKNIWDLIQSMRKPQVTILPP